MRLLFQILCLLPIVLCRQVILGTSDSTALHITKDELDALPQLAREAIIASKIPVRSGAKAPPGKAHGTALASQFAFKYVAGALNGNILWCQCTGGVNDQSVAFASASEIEQANIQFIGAAEITVHNVAPRIVPNAQDGCIQFCPVGTGVIEIWLEVNWGNPIDIMLSFLVINN
jgi:hypothetical protein